MKSSKGKGAAKTPSGPGKKAAMANRYKPKDPVEVYCRLRPLKEDETEVCAEAISESVLQITPPECSLAYRSGHRNGTQHTFKRVFNENIGQKEVFDTVGFPLVQDLLHGKNGLLFAYGITNSGKTYTMAGEADQPGVLPRSFDVIFNSIENVQAPRYVFRPDGVNGFDVYTEEEARAEQRRNKPKKVSARVRSEMPDFGDMVRVPETAKVEEGMEEDNSYTVFVSYIEIYNNFVYDLLDDTLIDPIKPKPPQSKIVREDHFRNMYVSKATEVEVKSSEEAFEMLYKGQKRRRVAHTQLNQESSRSHSVFTVRLVQAPLDPSGEEVLQDKSKVVISQLSLVDLAGSERTSRTQSCGDRLREASNINANLMVLRTCMETLRDNQTNDGNKIVPYRDSKLTHLFKNYFDGEGKVRMVVCVSPHAEDYDESIHVMRFAEVTQEVVVDRPETVQMDLGLARGRRRANLLYKAALREAAVSSSEGTSEGSSEDLSSPSSSHPYLLALGVLAVQKYISEDCLSGTLAEFKERLESREKVRTQLIQDLKKKQVAFRQQLVTQELELSELQTTVSTLRSRKASQEKSLKEVPQLKSVISSQDEQIAHLQARLEQMNSELSRLQEHQSRVTQQNQYLMRTTEMYEADKRDMECELHEQQVEKERTKQEKQELRKKMQGYVSNEREKFERLAQKMKIRERDLANKSEKLRQVKELIRNSPMTSMRTPLRENNTPARTVGTRASVEPPAAEAVKIPTRGKGRKRSLSENWLEHKPASTVESGGVMQPQMKKKKTVTTPKAKHLKAKQVDHYCLRHQEEDSAGDVKTELYKGEILHTRGGGMSVQFTDVEILKHTKPSVQPRRSSRLAADQQSLQTSASDLSEESSMECVTETEEWTDVETRCAVAIEGRPGGAKPALTHTTAAKPVKK